MNREKLNNFRKKYKHLERYGLQIDGLSDMMGIPVIAVNHPFIFDHRLLPEKFEGITIRNSTSGKLPKEFIIDDSDVFWHEKYYVWSPERFEKFVDRCSEEIKKQLGSPNMSKEEMLDALCFGDFKRHKKEVEQHIKEGKLPKYQE